MYYVYDNKGIVVDSFMFSDGEAASPVGLYEKNVLEERYEISEINRWVTDVENPVKFEGGYLLLPVWDPESEQFNDDYYRVITDLGEEIEILKHTVDSSDSEWYVTILSDYTAISIVERISDADEKYLRLNVVCVGKDGAVLSERSLDRLPIGWIHLLGSQTVICSEYEGNAQFGPARLIDGTGNVLSEDVEPIYGNWIAGYYESEFSVEIDEYYISEDTVYDSNGSVIADGTKTADGKYIPGLNYFVNGITCRVTGQSPSEYAVGKKGTESVAVKSIWGDCEIRVTNADDLSVYGVSPSMVILSDYSVYSLASGALLDNITPKEGFDHCSYQLGDTCLVIECYSFLDNSSPESTFYVYDADGNLRYFTDKNDVAPTGNGLIVLRRGSYIGIADLNGEWVIKTLDPFVKRDAEEPTYQ